MRFVLTFLSLSLMAFAPADSARGQNAPIPVLETVSFRLNEGVSDHDFLAAAQRTQEALALQSGYVARQLLCDDTGVWTDLVSWHSLEQAKAVAAILEKDSAFGALIGMIDLSTLQMAHTPILWQIGG